MKKRSGEEIFLDIFVKILLLAVAIAIVVVLVKCFFILLACAAIALLFWGTYIFWTMVLPNDSETGLNKKR